jgi:hypothetical protein
VANFHSCSAAERSTASLASAISFTRTSLSRTGSRCVFSSCTSTSFRSLFHAWLMVDTASETYKSLKSFKTPFSRSFSGTCSRQTAQTSTALALQNMPRGGSSLCTFAILAHQVAQKFERSCL